MSFAMFKFFAASTNSQSEGSDAERTKRDETREAGDREVEGGKEES